MKHQGEKVREILKLRRMSDQNVAEILGITRSGVLDIYKREIIKPKQLQEIVQKLNISLSELGVNEGVNSPNGDYLLHVLEENKLLKEQIEAQKKIIHLLEEKLNKQ